MSLQITVLPECATEIGQQRTSMVDVMADDDYPEGGYPIVPGDVGLARVLGVSCVGSNADGLIYVPVYNIDSQKLQFTGLDTRTSNYTTPLDGADNLAGTEGNADQAAGPTNFDLLFAGDDIGNLTDNTITPIDEPDVPRSIVITLENGTVGALNLFEGVTTFLVTGTDYLDAALTESITLTSTLGDKSVAASKFRFIQGVEAFKTITNIVITNPPADDFTVYVGPGTQIAIDTPLMTPAITDVASASVDGTPVTIEADTTVAGGVDPVRNTIQVGDVNDTDELIVDYNITNEIVDGLNLSSTSKRLIFYGQ